MKTNNVSLGFNRAGIPKVSSEVKKVKNTKRSKKFKYDTSISILDNVEAYLKFTNDDRRFYDTVCDVFKDSIIGVEILDGKTDLGEPAKFKRIKFKDGTECTLATYEEH